MNAARLLAETFRSWALAPNDVAENVRASEESTADTPDFWHRQARVVALIGLVERDLDALESLGGTSVHSFRKHVPAWYQAVACYQPQAWRTPAPTPIPAVPDNALDALDGVAEFVDALSMNFGHTDVSSTELVQILADAEAAAKDAQDLATHTKRYLLALVRGASDALTLGAALTPEELTRLINEMVGVLTTIAVTYTQAGDTNQANRWATLVFRLWKITNQPIAAGVITGVTLQAIGSA